MATKRDAAMRRRHTSLAPTRRLPWHRPAVQAAAPGLAIAAWLPCLWALSPPAPALMHHSGLLVFA